MGVTGDGRPHGALRWFLAKADMAPARDCEVSLFMSGYEERLPGRASCRRLAIRLNPMAPNARTGSGEVLGSLTLLVMMKGHVGGGSGFLEPLGSGQPVKAKPFHGFPSKYYFDGCPLCPHTQTPVCIFVQERLPEMPALVLSIPMGLGVVT